MGSPAPRTPPPLDGIAASHLQVPQGPWPTLLDALCARFPGVPRGQWRSRLARGRVLDGAFAPLSVEAPCRAGMDVYYYREVADEPAIAARETIVHVDRDLVVVDKPHFLPVVPAGRFVRETLLGRVQRALGNLALVPLHRLDRATAGLVLFSANPATRARYHALFREGRIEKRYLAVAAPLPGVSFPLARGSRLVRGEPFFRMREEAGEANSLTRLAVLRRGGTHWLYGLEPVTGRKHQLRVHMAALGAAILNDPLYPVLAPPHDDDPARPLQLLAHSLGFDDPLTGARRHFVSDRQLGEAPAAQDAGDEA